MLATFVIFANGQSSLQSGLVAWYPFDGNASDMSGNGNHGTVNGATLGTDRHGQANRAYSFDGVDDYIEVFDDDVINFPLHLPFHLVCGLIHQEINWGDYIKKRSIWF